MTDSDPVDPTGGPALPDNLLHTLREAGYLAHGLPQSSRRLLTVQCSRCSGYLRQVHSTEVDGPLFTGTLVTEMWRPSVRELPVLRLLRRPPDGVLDPDQIFVSCMNGSCKGRYVLQRHELLVEANRRNTRRWRPTTVTG